MFEDREQHDPVELVMSFFLEFEPFIALTKFSYVQHVFAARTPEEAREKYATLAQDDSVNEQIKAFAASKESSLSLLDTDIDGYKSVRCFKENIFTITPEPDKRLPENLDAYFADMSSFEPVEISQEMKDLNLTEQRFKNEKVVVSFPKLMLIRINRTLFDPTNPTVPKKNVDLVNMERHVVIHGNRYKMFGFIVHLGDRGGSGHYISCVHSVKKRGWFCYDDEAVKFYEDDKYDEMLVDSRALKDKIVDNRVFYIYRKQK